MIVSVFSDGEKKDKVAEFYDTSYPCTFLRGLLVETQEQENESQLMFVARQEVGLSPEVRPYYTTELLRGNTELMRNE